jgi:hypothetical protein
MALSGLLPQFQSSEIISREFHEGEPMAIDRNVLRSLIDEIDGLFHSVADPLGESLKGWIKRARWRALADLVWMT